MSVDLKKTLLVSSCTVFELSGKFLISHRPENKSYGGFWEFPGGKIENGETPEDALVRELFEELAIVVNPSSLVPITFVSHPYDSFHLLMTFLLVMILKVFRNLMKVRKYNG
ncbi:(deoxy)nucleoside triphosphate pyrophosphohydrolase [Candidatus Liberibacter brunswickensis]|uniref:(deoxy)nucleoside triphosphate pyrophosphohydrolase n=1 Tax=Candidatus Liberibacter brunswickensis TaxID=1968796 RepID=UPI002FE30307